MPLTVLFLLWKYEVCPLGCTDTKWLGEDLPRSRARLAKSLLIWGWWMSPSWPGAMLLYYLACVRGRFCSASWMLRCIDLSMDSCGSYSTMLIVCPWTIAFCVITFACWDGGRWPGPFWIFPVIRFYLEWSRPRNCLIAFFCWMTYHCDLSP